MDTYGDCFEQRLCFLARAMMQSMSLMQTVVCGIKTCKGLLRVYLAKAGTAQTADLDKVVFAGCIAKGAGF